MSGLPVGSAPNARTPLAAARAGALALALLAGCGGGPRPFQQIDGAVVFGQCSQSAPPMPAVHIGPDATIHALCSTTGSAAVASVDERGAGTTSWSASVKGVPANAFFFKPGSFQTCQASGPTVASVLFQAPAGAVPGDTFDAVVTVHADDGSFPDGTVNVHAEIVAPSVTVDRTTVDFGDVLPNTKWTQVLTFAVPAKENVSILPPPPLYPPFSLRTISSTLGQQIVETWSVDFTSLVPGDFSASLGFTTGSNTIVPAACQWTTTIALHARVLGDGGVADAGADGDAQ